MCVSQKFENCKHKYNRNETANLPCYFNLKLCSVFTRCRKCNLENNLINLEIRAYVIKSCVYSSDIKRVCFKHSNAARHVYMRAHKRTIFASACFNNDKMKLIRSRARPSKANIFDEVLLS